MTPAERAARVQAWAPAAGGWAAWAAAAGVSRTQLWQIAHADPRPRQAAVLARLALAAGQPWDALGAADDLPAGTGRKLVAARLQRGWPAREIEQRAGIGHRHYARIEAGTVAPRPATWQALAAALDVPPAQIQP